MGPGYTGSLTCSSDCNDISTSSCIAPHVGVCYDGAIDIGEVCDGTLFGGDTCSDYDSYTEGTLTCLANCKTIGTASCTPQGTTDTCPISPADGDVCSGVTYSLKDANDLVCRVVVGTATCNSANCPTSPVASAICNGVTDLTYDSTNGKVCRVIVGTKNCGTTNCPTSPANGDVCNGVTYDVLDTVTRLVCRSGTGIKTGCTTCPTSPVASTLCTSTIDYTYDNNGNLCRSVIGKKNCLGPSVAKFCGNGIISKPNLNDFYEQCDPNDYPAPSSTKLPVFVIGKETCALMELGTGTRDLRCLSTCELDYSGCASDGNDCGDGVAGSKEACDGDDFKGTTCQYLGYTEDGLKGLECNAPGTPNECKISSTSTCKGGETGTSSFCLIASKVITNCIDGNGKKTIKWTPIWTDDNPNTNDPSYINCMAKESEEMYPCPAQVQLPFFDYMQMIIAIAVIAIVYASSLFRSRFRKKNSK